ncbi:cytochrome P450 [Daedaleopsis nitida]|nr:cytochrome P450 [Daedaleopsis nitida]
MFDIPKSRPWLWYKELSDEYGDVAHFRALGQSFIVLGSADAIFQYLDKRSGNTSDRKQSPMIELSGNSLNLGFMPYGQRWRRHRRTFWQHFHKEAVNNYQSTQRSNAHMFLERLLEEPERLTSHLRYAFTNLVLKVAYGIELADDDHTYTAIGEAAIEGSIEGLVPGKFLVEFLPFLRHIPTWIPGAASQRLFSKWIAAGDRLKNVPYEHMKSSIERAEVSRSILGQLYTRFIAGRRDVDHDQEEIIKNVGAITYLGVFHYTFSTSECMFHALSLHPDVVKRAQKELDEVVGPNRMPDWDDRDALVYITAILLETMRWRSILPIALPHGTTTDDEFRGYFVPAGTVLIPNVWACMHDPEVYESPDEFRPERFIRDGKINQDMRSPLSFIFGFGRRICPGRYFALAGLFIQAASVLHVFDIGPPLDEAGRPIMVDSTMTDGFLVYPKDCRCTIKPRSAQAEALIHDCSRLARSQD